ncbi:hypothetical protein CBP28_16640 [Fischerella thermalis WC559]|nr:hypothetical protein CBP17_10210 [Fischerella thermalis WC114]PLZ15146.1 hypothetical protein CBP18_01140 [Fischerella thermalis WC119]PLZ16106.1 hypothetical protein CBP19_05220 [Fischerella thermalis WC1110]PLZ16478.1 hypothetical protein CBP30_22625 [Fischerella thermalis WC157]PLZ25067.1 hypothetical protein CBP28_16640 [Fischerella thermalis WC559]PLZ28346.1 hypothetical protein CBP10_17130 [Fischerella thermalis WC558]PLZ28463.1 hypothetical protein CBP29_02240 [Fischerella thermalis
MFEKYLAMYQIRLDPPKSPANLGDFKKLSPLGKGRAVSFAQVRILSRVLAVKFREVGNRKITDSTMKFQCDRHDNYPI